MGYAGTFPRGMNFENNRWVFRCPNERCFFARQYPSEDSDTSHKCPYINGETRISWMSYGPSLLEQTFAELDAVTEKIMRGDRSDSNIGYARGLAWTLSLFMAPHLRTVEEVSREAAKRFKMKEAGEAYDTPGLGSRKYEAPPDNDKLATRTPPRTGGSAPVKNKLGEAEIAAIKAAGDMFSAKELAGIYNVSIKHVEDIINGA